MQNWTFEDFVHAAEVRGDLVLLDLRSDTYACIPSSGPEAASGWLADPKSLSADVREALLDSGAIRDGGGDISRAPPPAIATRDLRNRPSAEITTADWIDALAALWSLNRIGFDAPVERLAGLSARTEHDIDQDAVVRASLAFSRILPWLPIRNQCLHRSALLAAFLGRRGLAADWIFGVRTWPFRAHCWMQAGDICLNDDRERLQTYTAIFVAR